MPSRYWSRRSRIRRHRAMHGPISAPRACKTVIQLAPVSRPSGRRCFSDTVQTTMSISSGFGARPAARGIEARSAGFPSGIDLQRPDFAVTIRCIWATQRPHPEPQHHEPSRQETPPPGGRSPEGRASLSGLASRAAGASSGRQAAGALFGLGAPRAKAGAFRSRAGEDRRRAAAAADQGPDRGRDRGREQHARRPLSRGAFSRPVVLPHPAHRPQRRVARQRQARRQQGPDRGGAEHSHSAAQARYAEGRRPSSRKPRPRRCRRSRT